MKNVVLFDFDGTLTSADTTKYLVFELAKIRPCRALGLFPYFAWAVYAKFQGGAIQPVKNAVLAFLLKGLTDRQLHDALIQFSSAVSALYRVEVLQRLRDLLATGVCPLIVTASPEFAIAHCLKSIPVEVIGTRFMKVDGVFNGALEGDSCYGDSKLDFIDRWVKSQAEDVCFVEAWSDSFSDLGMMKMAPVRHWVIRDSDRSRLQRIDPDGNVHVSQ